MTKPRKTQLYAVYLLHFDAPVGRSRHYVGMCKAARLHRRQQEHVRGVGSRLTAQAAALGIGWRIARVWYSATPHKEREIKASGHFDQKCPLCEASRAGESLPPIQIHYQPQKPARAFEPLDHARAKNVSRYRA